ncbi:MAG: hypothetical protein OSJ61_26135 [Lachnospiraceae bacterium]|nr:hypothetical protein [Lachnospiraceae bacterium]
MSIIRVLGTIQKLLVTRTPYKCSNAKKKITNVGGIGIYGIKQKDCPTGFGTSGKK